MPINDFRLKTDSKISEYQKAVDNIENVILCMAEAERMVQEIGKNMIDEDELFQIKQSISKKSGRRSYYKNKKVENSSNL
jgi:hypothetical protein